MNILHASLFGKFQLQDCDGVTIDIPGRKVQELLCYLLIFRHIPHSREKLAEALWDEGVCENAKGYLRRTLWQLQQAFEPCQNFGQGLLLIDPDWIQVNPEATIWLDMAILEEAYQQVKGIPGELLDVPSTRVLQEATDLYQGELLEGWYQTWCIEERERLHHLFMLMLDKLIRYCEVQGELEPGIQLCRRILQFDRAREQTHRQLMRLLYFARDRSSALRQYEHCINAMREELEVEPTQRTQLLVEQIRQDQLITTISPLPGMGPDEAIDMKLMQRVMVELEQIQNALHDIQRRVNRISRKVNHHLYTDDNGEIGG